MCNVLFVIATVMCMCSEVRNFEIDFEKGCHTAHAHAILAYRHIYALAATARPSTASLVCSPSCHANRLTPVTTADRSGLFSTGTAEHTNQNPPLHLLSVHPHRYFTSQRQALAPLPLPRAAPARPAVDGRLVLGSAPLPDAKLAPMLVCLPGVIVAREFKRVLWPCAGW